MEEKVITNINLNIDLAFVSAKDLYHSVKCLEDLTLEMGLKTDSTLKLRHIV